MSRLAGPSAYARCLEVGSEDPDPLGAVGPLNIELLDSTRQLSAAQLGFIAESLGAIGVLESLTGEVRLSIVADAAMSRLHDRYSGDPATTDVLTFDLAEGAAAQSRTLDVDVYACVDEAQRQAFTRGHPVERELLLYAQHGTIHK